MTGFQQSKESEITCEHSGIQLHLKKIFSLKELSPLLIPVNDSRVGSFKKEIVVILKNHLVV